MPWVKVDDSYLDHTKHVQVGPLGNALWLAGLAYCNRNLTDGFIPWAKARALLSWDFLGPPDDQGRQKEYSISISCGMAGQDVQSDFVIRLLVEAELWEEVAGGYQIHDYLAYQPSREEVLAQRDKLHAIRSEAGRKGAENRWQNSKPDGKTIANDMASEWQADSKPDGKRMAPYPVSRFPDPITQKEERESAPSAPCADKPRRAPLFHKPTLDECIVAFKETQYPEEAEPFFDYYSANGWRVGRNSMRDVAAAIRNWLRHRAEHGYGSNGNGKAPKREPIDDKIARLAAERAERQHNGRRLP